MCFETGTGASKEVTEGVLSEVALAILVQRNNAEVYRDTPFDHFMFDFVGADLAMRETPPPVYGYFEPKDSIQPYPELLFAGYTSEMQAVAIRTRGYQNSTYYFVLFIDLLMGEKTIWEDADVEKNFGTQILSWGNERLLYCNSDGTFELSDGSVSERLHSIFQLKLTVDALESGEALSSSFKEAFVA